MQETPPSITFCTCIESGQLEHQVVLMCDSLRRFGGRLSGAPVLAVRPRGGPPLRRATRRELDRMEVRVVDARPSSRYPWYLFLNKPVTLLEAERVAATRTIAWLDGDVIVAASPDGLDLPDGTDFAAVAPNKNVGTLGPDDENEPFWRAVGEVLEVDLDALPWLFTSRERGRRIRLYFNAGVFAVRRDAGLGRAYYDSTEKLLDAGISSRNAGLFFHEQVALSFAVHKLGLRWVDLPEAYNYSTGEQVDHEYDPAELRRAKLLHYHSSLYPPFYEKFLGYLRAEQPPVAAWLAPAGPMPARVPLPAKVINMLRRKWRTRRTKSHAAGCRVV